MSGVGFGKNIVEGFSQKLTEQLEKQGVKDASKAVDKTLGKVPEGMILKENVALSKDLMKKGVLSDHIVNLSEPVTSAGTARAIKGIETALDKNIELAIDKTLSSDVILNKNFIIDKTDKLDAFRELQSALFEKYDMSMPGKEVFNSILTTHSQIGLTKESLGNVIDTFVNHLKNNPGKSVSVSDMSKTIMQMVENGKVQDFEAFYLINNLARESVSTLDSGGAGPIEEAAMEIINDAMNKNTPDIDGWITATANITEVISSVEKRIGSISAEPVHAADNSAILNSLKAYNNASKETIKEVSAKISEGKFSGSIRHQEKLIVDISNTMKLSAFDAVSESSAKLSDNTKKHLYNNLFKIYSLDTPSNSLKDIVRLSKAMHNMGEISSVYDHFEMQRSLAENTARTLRATGENRLAAELLEQALQISDRNFGDRYLHDAFLDIEQNFLH